MRNESGLATSTKPSPLPIDIFDSACCEANQMPELRLLTGRIVRHRDNSAPCSFSPKVI